MEVVALTGPSGSGKTTIVCELIAQLVAEGKRVAAIKHTHHPLNLDERGDTARFRAAGAHAVIFAGSDEAVVNGAIVNYSDPRELLAHAGNADVVLVEGFKHFEGWRRVEVSRETNWREVRRMMGR